MRITRLRLAAVAATALAATVALAGCSGTSDASGSAAPAADPSSLVLALVPSQDQGGLVDTAKPLTDMLSSDSASP